MANAGKGNQSIPGVSSNLHLVTYLCLFVFTYFSYSEILAKSQRTTQVLAMLGGLVIFILNMSLSGYFKSG